MNYDSNEVFAIPKGIVSGTNIRIDNKVYSHFKK